MNYVFGIDDSLKFNINVGYVQPSATNNALVGLSIPMLSGIYLPIICGNSTVIEEE